MSRLLESLLGILPGMFVVIFLVILGVYWVQRFRRDLNHDSHKDMDALHQEFLKLRRDGKISDKEYQAIRGKLSSGGQPGGVDRDSSIGAR